MSEERIVIIVAGPGSVGKSAITLQFITQTFVQDHDPTIEESYQKTVTLNNKSFPLEIQDTAGQEEYSTLRSHNFRAGHGFLLIYSVDNRKGFEEIEEFRKEITRAKDCDNVPIVLCANKIDLPSEEHEVSKKEGQDLAKNYQVPFIETSAKEVINIDEAFQSIVKLVVEWEQKKNSKGKGKGKGKGKKDCVLM
ncbi:ras-like protein [Anaeramoeba flamelloides]|uniref:Ras-like protein n=1 Tax=Anaeramoeba flamelloides TaxID=1746091 RepID=A0AAV7ZIL8_9EUKA|nr:ras-like protein [Anaeramoeba flamelloides]KAJ3441794.1 ras-like protein [Anaeramoeba flamelloides]KAJ6232763.1 ras-like protein [Anaeramoeba flamelloides]KAJ6240264.1 ras-like protein [Anaeramoeba flamelloides]